MMVDMNSNDDRLAKPVRGPRARTCHVCGRPYTIAGFPIHLEQCKQLWLKRESLKPKHERRPLPEDPTIHLTIGAASTGAGDQLLPALDGTSGMANMNGTANASLRQPVQNPQELTHEQLDALNAAAEDAFNTQSLAACEYCGRTFLPEKLAVHHRSCTAETPARRVGEAAAGHTAAGSGPGHMSRNDSGFALGASDLAAATPISSRPKTTSGTRRPLRSPPLEALPGAGAAAAGVVFSPPGGLPKQTSVSPGTLSTAASTRGVSPAVLSTPNPHRSAATGAASADAADLQHVREQITALEDVIHAATTQLHLLKESVEVMWQRQALLNPPSLNGGGGEGSGPTQNEDGRPPSASRQSTDVAAGPADKTTES